LEALKGADVGVCLDTGHAYLAGDLWNVAQKLGDRLKVIHASDNKGKYDDHLPPGEGAIDWLRFCRQLHDSGFQGSIIMEIAGKGETQHILESAQQARRFLYSISTNTSSSDTTTL
jgi:sugar phosphate isomerase/epimerase